MLISVGGRSPGANSEHLPDWVDDTVARWIESETAAMQAAWGPGMNREAIAFVHIPPLVGQILYLSILLTPRMSLDFRHAIERVQKTLNETQNPGLDGK